jgi:hypothetical protein
MLTSSRPFLRAPEATAPRRLAVRAAPECIRTGAPCHPTGRSTRGCCQSAASSRRKGSGLRRLCWWACQDLNLGPHPYQQNAGNRCAKRRSRRSRSTVQAEVMCSHRVQLCALVLRLHPTAPHRPFQPLHARIERSGSFAISRIAGAQRGGVAVQPHPEEDLLRVGCKQHLWYGARVPAW